MSTFRRLPAVRCGPQAGNRISLIVMHWHSTGSCQGCAECHERDAELIAKRMVLCRCCSMPTRVRLHDGMQDRLEIAFFRSESRRRCLKLTFWIDPLRRNQTRISVPSTLGMDIRNRRWNVFSSRRRFHLGVSGSRKCQSPRKASRVLAATANGVGQVLATAKNKDADA